MDANEARFELEALLEREGAVYLRALTTVDENVDAIIDHNVWSMEEDERKISKYILLNGEADSKTALAYNEFADDTSVEDISAIKFLGDLTLYMADTKIWNEDKVVVKVNVPVFEYEGRKYILGDEAEKLEEEFGMDSSFDDFFLRRPTHFEHYI